MWVISAKRNVNGTLEQPVCSHPRRLSAPMCHKQVHRLISRSTHSAQFNYPSRTELCHLLMHPFTYSSCAEAGWQEKCRSRKNPNPLLYALLTVPVLTSTLRWCPKLMLHAKSHHTLDRIDWARCIILVTPSEPRASIAPQFAFTEKQENSKPIASLFCFQWTGRSGKWSIEPGLCRRKSASMWTYSRYREVGSFSKTIVQKI